jgi:hypothetical protein
VTVPLVAVPVAAAQSRPQLTSVQVVTVWNRVMLDALEADHTPPPPAMRIGAIVQASVFDAVNGITHRFAPYRIAGSGPRGASASAAAAGAAHEALVKLFPAQQATFDAQLRATVSGLRGDAPAIANGLAWGGAVADALVIERSTDGIAAVLPPYTASADPGRWQPTPPLFGPPVFRQFAAMTPFAMASPSQFLPPPPPALTSAQYSQDFAEVKAVGSANSTSRSASDTQTAVFWNSDVPVALWDRAADDLIGSSHLSITSAARLLARENIAMGDAVIAIWNAKGFYDRWRPVTAIRAADTDGNPLTEPDPAWSPLLITPPFQEYPSGHSGVSAAAAAVLADQFGNATAFTLTSPNLPGVARSFTSFTNAVAQVSDARVFAGIHFRFACTTAITMGRAVANNVLATQMARVAHTRSE